ncbi:MAG: hypothetical protein IJN42_01315 [Clostridia bacterium]|nr:hypothetical protein [Clostridia bacterium]
MKIKIKTILAILLCVVGVIWLIPTVFVQKVPFTITDFELVGGNEFEDEFEIQFTYPKGDKIESDVYTDTYPKSWTPAVGGQQVGYYFTVPPYTVHPGDAPSPVLPLCCFGLGLVTFAFNPSVFLKLFKKKEAKNNEE